MHSNLGDVSESLKIYRQGLHVSAADAKICDGCSTILHAKMECIGIHVICLIWSSMSQISFAQCLLAGVAKHIHFL